MTIGVLAALGQSQLVEIQFQSALDRGELTEEQVRETVLHLTHYIGWPLSTGVNAVAEKVIARRQAEGRPVSQAADGRGAGSAPMVRFDFSGKVAIVTGAGGGIGQAYAEALAAAGASVMVADIAEDNAAAVATAINASGGTATSVRVDVADPASAQAMAEATVDAFGGIDYLVNNAAIFGGMQLDLLLTVDWEYLNRFLSVNMLGALNCVRACYPAMKARGGGPSSTSPPPPPTCTPASTGWPRPASTRSPSSWPTSSVARTSAPTPSPPGPSTPRPRGRWCPTPS